MPDDVPAPVFPEIPATKPTVVPPASGATFDQWFFTGTRISWMGGQAYDLESFWAKGNAVALNGETTNNIVRDFVNLESLKQQLGQDFLDANPDVLEIMPHFLQVMAKIAKRQGVL
jgi:hypothetical protein